MYKVTRESGRVTVTDSDGKVVYAADDDSIVVYRANGTNTVRHGKVSTFTDEALLVALANVVRLGA